MLVAKEYMGWKQQDVAKRKYQHVGYDAAEIEASHNEMWDIPSWDEQ